MSSPIERPDQPARHVGVCIVALATLVIAAACETDPPASTAPRTGIRGALHTTVIGANVVVLPTLGGGAPFAADINDAGQVVGSGATTLGGRSHAFLWSPSDGMRDLGTLGGDNSFAEAINNAGEVVGASVISGSFAQHAFLWTPGHGMQDLGTLGGKTSGARGINDRGEVVGRADMPNGDTHAFLWTPEKGMQDLGALPGNSSTGDAINNATQVTGTSNTTVGSDDLHAFLWTASRGMTDLGSLGGDPTVALGLNNSGWVVGRTQTIPARAFLWLPSDGMRDLGNLGAAGRDAIASDVNDAGQVVGWSTTAGGGVHAFLWTMAGGMEDIYSVTGIPHPAAINNRGQVTGEDRVATLQFQRPNRAPNANAGGPYVGSKKKPVAFDGTRSVDPDADVLTYAWDFGDGSRVVGGATPIHEYEAWGTYTVTLTVWDPAGLSGVQTTTATIAPPGQLKSKP